ncbi:MAG: hypothetical protein K8R90_08970 [Candidatus Cloacimonetes bacterium]|nr:hypothetical protein [Candidatus Cloacimonadota bacterium]
MQYKEKYLIVLLGIILLSFVFFYTGNLMIKGQIKDIKKFDRRIGKAIDRLNSAQVLNRELSGVSRVIRNSITDSETEKFPAEDINAFVNQLGNFADTLKIPVVSLSPKESYSPGKVMEHQFTIVFECTYVQLGQFVTKLERSDMIIRINTFDVLPIREDKKLLAQAEAEAAGEVEEIATRYRVTLDLSTFKVRKEEA